LNSRFASFHKPQLRLTAEYLQMPSLVAVETQIAHSERKTEKAESTGNIVEKEGEEQETQLARLKSDLDGVKKAAHQAEGMFAVPAESSLTYCADTILEEQRKASSKGIALSEEYLAEYHAL